MSRTFAPHMACAAVALLGLWWPADRHVVSAAAVCSILTLIGFSLSPGGGRMQDALVNRPYVVDRAHLAHSRSESSKECPREA